MNRHVAILSCEPMMAAGIHAAIRQPHVDVSICRSFSAFNKMFAGKRIDVILTDDIPFILQWRSSELYIENTRLILMAEQSDSRIASIVSSSGTSGVIRKDCTPAEMRQCLDAVMLGNTWFPQQLMGMLLTGKRSGLTKRFRDVALLVSDGCSNKKIAHTLGLSEGTIKVYVSKIFDAVGVESRLQLGLWVKENLVTPKP